MQSELMFGTQQEAWPALPLQAWRDTCTTLQMWTQVIGKVRMALSAPVNHWWHIPLYVSVRGLRTSSIPYRIGAFEIEFDFISHDLRFSTSWGLARSIPLRPMTVADFYRASMDTLQELGVAVSVWPVAVEMEHPVRLDRDSDHTAYDAEYANRFWRVLLQTDHVFKQFRSYFLGKVSPVHFFWGAFDLAVTRFSGRTAPEHPGGIPNVGDFVMREAYSHEVSSAGFWPGGGALDEPAFYSYAYPEPPGFKDQAVRPKEAYYHEQMREFLLPYEAMRTAADPNNALFEFLQSSYEAAADLAKWDRASLERSLGR